MNRQANRQAHYLRRLFQGGWILSLTVLLLTSLILPFLPQSDYQRLKDPEESGGGPNGVYLPILSPTASKLFAAAEARYLQGVRDVLGAEFSEEFYLCAVQTGRLRLEELTAENELTAECKSPSDNETLREYLRSFEAEDPEGCQAVSEFLAAFDSSLTACSPLRETDEKCQPYGALDEDAAQFYLPGAQEAIFRNPFDDLVRFHCGQMTAVLPPSEWLFRQRLIPLAFGLNFSLFLAVLGLSLFEKESPLLTFLTGDSLRRILLFLESLTLRARGLARWLLQSLRLLLAGSGSPFLFADGGFYRGPNGYLETKLSVCLRN